MSRSRIYNNLLYLKDCALSSKWRRISALKTVDLSPVETRNKSSIVFEKRNNIYREKTLALMLKVEAKLTKFQYKLCY